jgi:hypothetical protein
MMALSMLESAEEKRMVYAKVERMLAAEGSGREDG